MTIIPVGYGQATWRFSGSGVPRGAACTMGFENGLPRTALQCAVALRDMWVTRINPQLVQNTGLQDCLVKLGPSETGPSAVAASGDGGDDTSAQAPPNVAYLVNKNTELGGRRGRGRMFVPGVDETEILQGGDIQATKLTPLQTAFNNLLLDMTANDLAPVLLHDTAKIWVLVDGKPRQVDDPNAPAPPAPTLITSLSVSSVVATQRRRLRS